MWNRNHSRKSQEMVATVIARLTLRRLLRLLLLVLWLTLLILGRWGFAVRWCWRFGAVGELEAVADDVEVLLRKIGFKKLTVGRVEKLDRDGVLGTDGGARVFH